VWVDLFSGRGACWTAPATLHGLVVGVTQPAAAPSRRRRLNSLRRCARPCPGKKGERRLDSVWVSAVRVVSESRNRELLAAHDAALFGSRGRGVSGRRSSTRRRGSGPPCGGRGAGEGGGAPRCRARRAGGSNGETDLYLSRRRPLGPRRELFSPRFSSSPGFPPRAPEQGTLSSPPSPR
jgi:hypothetical protein